ncbi:hypothetical protein L484_016189 [Morus notabilis]|uniref:Uncharacterized protein n=1 Tax=Morus notabilis TaxID=981085 RepID=W9RQA9_9ROSA|nr:hypothetical protein L484_016189 [Morus notabilis]
MGDGESNPKILCLLFRSLRNPFLSLWRLESSEFKLWNLPFRRKMRSFLAPKQLPPDLARIRLRDSCFSEGVIVDTPTEASL